MRNLFLLILTGILVLPVYPQSNPSHKIQNSGASDKKVSFFKDTPLPEALKKIDLLFEKYENKTVENKSDYNGSIGIDIEGLYYRQALREIAANEGLDINESDSVLVLQKKSDDPMDSRQVNIDAVFFEANISQMKERGINWNALFSKAGLIINPSLNSGQASDVQRELGPGFKIDASSASDLGKFSQYTTALLNFFEQENLGRLLAKLSLTVRDGKEGRIQIGSDFSVKQYDFAGNVIDRFYPTGTIIKVTPHIHKEDTLYYALLNLNVEKSLFIPGALNNEIKKETAQTDVLLFNNEEAAVGGLMTSEVVKERGGIPVLKDLPWWVFGLRYLTGYDQKKIVEKEIIILVKIKVIPTLRERIKAAKKDLIEEKLKQDKKELQRYHMESPENEKNK